MTAWRFGNNLLFARGVALCLVLITFPAVQIQQRTLRWRAERLSADMHQIRLHQSTWTDAQQLMHRWGGWGHYDGSCTAASCMYEIEMDTCMRMALVRDPLNR